MHSFRIVQQESEISLSKDWHPATKFNCNDKKVDKQGKELPNDYSGRGYQFVSKYERDFSKLERFGRGLAGTLLTLSFFGVVFFSKSIQNLFTKKKETIRFAKVIDVTKKSNEPVKADNSTPPIQATPEIPLKHTILSEPPEKKTPTIHPLPQPPEGVIKNGYGEYLVYRTNVEGAKESITEDEYKKIYDLIEETRALKGDQIPKDRHAHLKENIQKKLGESVHLAFIPRTLYELIFLRECIQEDITAKRCCNIDSTGAHIVFNEELAEEKKKELFPYAMTKGFWQQCLFEDEDYENQLKPRLNDYRQDHVKSIAAKLNEVALKQFKVIASKDEGFTYEEIDAVQAEMIKFYTELGQTPHVFSKPNPKSPSILHVFAEEIDNLREEAGKRFPIGISNDRHKEIMQKASQLECSAEAINSMILYRGAILASDELVRQESKYKEKSPILPNSLSYGNSLFAGALYDRSASAFHYMRQNHLDAQALVFPLSELDSPQNPFNLFNVHPIIQMDSKGEYFHGRTKLWKAQGQVMGYFGTGTSDYSRVKEFGKTKMSQEETEKAFQRYKDKAYLLATAATD